MLASQLGIQRRRQVEVEVGRTKVVQVQVLEVKVQVRCDVLPLIVVTHTCNRVFAFFLPGGSGCPFPAVAAAPPVPIRGTSRRRRRHERRPLRVRRRPPHRVVPPEEGVLRVRRRPLGMWPRWNQIRRPICNRTLCRIFAASGGAGTSAAGIDSGVAPADAEGNFRRDGRMAQALTSLSCLRRALSEPGGALQRIAVVVLRVGPDAAGTCSAGGCGRFGRRCGRLGARRPPGPVEGVVTGIIASGGRVGGIGAAVGVRISPTEAAVGQDRVGFLHGGAELRRDMVQNSFSVAQMGASVKATAM